MSGDGKVVGVTLTGGDKGARIFEKNGARFQQRGSDFTVYGFKGGIALNYNGGIVIIGDSSYSPYRDRAGVFQWKDENNDGSMHWVQLGDDITADVAGDLLGDIGSVSITHDGLTVAVGASGYDGNGTDKGLVRVYNYAEPEQTWKQSGVDLVGDNSYDEFSRTSLSSDGTYLTVGAYVGNYVKIFGKNGNNYDIIGEKVNGELGYFGSSVDMSADGSTVAIGAYFFESRKGRCYLYHTGVSTSPPSTITSPPMSTPVLPPPSGNGNGGMC